MTSRHPPGEAPIPSYDEAMLSTGLHDADTGLPSPTSFGLVSPMGEGFSAAEAESRGLLRRGQERATPATAGSSSRIQYRPPTVETDDEDSIWSSSDDEHSPRRRVSQHGQHGHGESDDDDDETAHVRREMLELDMEDPMAASSAGRSLFGKGFSLSLPRWATNWRLSIPRLRLPLAGTADSPDAPTTPTPGAPTLASRFGRFGRLAGFARVNTSDEDEAASTSAATDTTRRRFFARPAWLQFNSAAAAAVFARVCGVVLVLGFVYLLFMSDLFTSLSRRIGSQVFDPESVRMHIQMSVNPARMRETTRHLTSYAHMAGTEGDFALAVDTKNQFIKYGLDDVTIDEYYVYLNYPRRDGRAVELVGADGAVTWTAALDEDEAGGEAAGHQTYVFHGHSKAGDVRGPLVYANYGTRDDFRRLADAGVPLQNTIALVRYYGPTADPGLKVHAAELAGCAGVLLYSDPADDGFVRGTAAPDGPFMPADGVQRGSVALSSFVLGDPLTPGWESKKGLPRLEPGKAHGLVQIPSLPVAWRDAQTLLQSLRGKGQRVFDGWQGGVPEVGEWWTGSESSPTVRLRNEQDEERLQPVWNVYGRIEGVEQAAKKVIVGNHRDAWSFGAADPHSGTAVMLELVRIFGDLVERGWRPLRTIEFMSWDAGAYNMAGSTEYVEKHLDGLRRDGLAYINLDAAVTGRAFAASGSPVFSKLLAQVMKRVSDPHANASLFDLWQQHASALAPLGAASDYAAFQHMAGTSALDIRFASADGAPSSPAHSSYDNFAWMDRVGDPGFVYHGLLGEVAGLLLIELADRPVMPFDMTTYGQAVVQWTKDLAAWVHARASADATKTDPTKTERLPALGLLEQAAQVVAAAVHEFDRWDVKWESQVLGSGGWESAGLGEQRAEYVARMAAFETDLLDVASDGGLPGRKQFRHVLFGPQRWSSADAELFPAVRDLVDDGDWTAANKTVARIAHVLEVAALKLMQ